MKSFFSPPRFEDIREDHNARALNTILLVFILIFFAVALLNLLLQPEGYRLDISGLVLGFLIGNWAALKRGRLKLVSIGFPAGLWLIVNLAAYLSGGFSSPVILGHFLVMTFAGLFVGRRAGMVFSFLGVLAALVLFGVETLDRLPPPSFRFDPITQVTTLAGILLALGMMLYLEGSFLRQSLWSAGREINERRREISETILREERFNALFERTTEAIVFMDFDSTILEVNARACEMFGFTREELIGLKGLTLVETSQRHEGEDRLRRVLTGEQPEIYERNMTRKNGEQFPAEINLSIVLNRDNRPAYVQSVIRDISDRKRAELELMTRELQYRSLFERTNDAVFFISLDGYILRHNDRAAEMLGYEKDELAGRHVTDLVAETDQDDVRSRLANLNTGGSIALYERTFRKADGSLLRTEVNVAIVPDAAGKPSHIQSVVRDISDRREALNALRESEQKFRAFFETSDDAVYLKDANGMYLLVNPATAKVFGRNELDILFQRDADLFSPDDAQRITDFDQLVMHTGLRQSTESPIMIMGEERILFTTKMPYFAENGAVIGVIGVTRDTTDRRRYERELREFERRYHALFESSNDGVLILDLHGNVVEISDRAARMLGYAPHETVGKHITDFIPEVELAEHREKMREVLSGKKQPIYERLLINRSGKIFPAEINVGLVTNPVGEPVYIQALMRDISERKRVDADRERMVNDLQLRSNQIQTAFEVSKSISSTIDMDTLLNEIINLIQMRFNFYYFGMFLNDQAGEYAVLRAGSGEAGRKMLAAGHRLRIGGESMIGWSVAHHAARIALDVGRDAVRFDNPFLPETRSEMALPLMIHGKAIGAISVQSQYPAAFSNEDIAVLQIMADQLAIAIQNAALLEEIRSANEELEMRVHERTAQLEAANQDLESFSYSVSHDLRTPLRAIHGFTNILLESYASQFDPEAAGYLDKVRKNALKMGTLIDDILEFSRMGRKPIQKTRFSPVSMVRDILGDFEAEIRARQISIQLDALPAMHADQPLIRQVYVNLIGNAVKFTRGKPEVVIEIGALEQEARTVVYFVRDNGVGFDEKYASRLFGVFQRLHREEEFEGTGVGLAIVQRIILRHGGNIWCEAKEGAGATFFFTVPAAEGG